LTGNLSGDDFLVIPSFTLRHSQLDFLVIPSLTGNLISSIYKLLPMA
jgi:hypothetical protein